MSKDNWIKIEESPKHDGEYLCYDKSLDCQFVSFWDGLHWGYLGSIRVEVTHWMPLPEPPINN